MKLQRLILALCAAFVALICVPASGSAAPFGYVPCETGDSPKREWQSFGPQEFALHTGSCTDPVYQYFPVLSASFFGTGLRWLPLGPGRVDALQVVVTGYDLNSEGKDVGLAVCSGLDFPDDCGQQVRGATTVPSQPQVFNLSREAGDIPENADRLVLFASCSRVFPDLCESGGDHVEFSNLYATLDDPSPPEFDAFELPTDGWYNAPPQLSINATDPESGMLSSVISANGGSEQVSLCEGAGPSEECPVSSSAWSPGGIPLKQGRNIVSVDAFNKANSDVERKFSFRYDTVAPSPPSGLSAVGATGNWIQGDQLRLHWTNPTENQATATQSGVAGAVVQLEPADGWGWHDPGPGEQYFPAAGIDGVTLDLPWEDTWVARVKIADAAGNESEFRTLTIDNEDGFFSPPQSGPYPLPTLNIAGTTGAVTFTWGQGNFGRSGDCGYRGWIGIGTPPTLANDPSSQIAPSGVKSWTLGAGAVSKLVDGTNTLALAGVACSGRVSDNYSRTVEIDRVRPTVRLAPATRWLGAGSDLTLNADDPGAPESGSGVAGTWYRLDGGSLVSQSTDQLTVPLPPGRHTLAYGAVDELGNTSLDATTTVGIDDAAPIASVLALGDPIGAFRAIVSDEISGVVDAAVEISPAGAASWRRLGDRFAAAQGRTSPVELAFRVPDDGSLPAGEYELRVIARDEAGNVQTTALRTLRLPLRPPSTITASIASAAKPKVAHKSLTLVLGARSKLRGQLLAADGSPIVGAVLRVTAQRDSGGRRLLGEPRTSASGGYSLDLGTDVSRTLTVSYDGDAAHGPASSTARLNVRARISMHLTASRVRPGARLFAEGKVKLLSAAVPPTGVPIELQYCGRNGCTRVTITDHTDSDGGFSTAVPTSYAKRTKLSLRVRVRTLPGWPFAEGFSSRRSVVIR